MGSPALRLVLCAFAAGALAFPGAAQAGETQLRIVGGTQAGPDYPFTAYVEAADGSGKATSCGGTLIAARWVVTAAHCVTTADGSLRAPSSFLVALGTVDLKAVPQGGIHQVASVRRFPGYNTGNLHGDAALLELGRAASQPQARLPRPADQALWAEGMQARAAGWGATAEDGPVSDLLQFTTLPIRGDTRCFNTYGGGYDPVTQLCVGGGLATDTCQGDSGGPLLVGDGIGWMLAGLTSGGIGCATDAPGLYARVGADPVNSWIRSVVPQAEIDAPAAPTAGVPATFTASVRNPGGAYTSLRWDLDADGSFDDAAGATATRALAAGSNVIALEAGDAQGNREIRRILVNAAGSAAQNPPAAREPAAALRILRLSSKLRGRVLAVVAEATGPGIVRATGTIRAAGRSIVLRRAQATVAAAGPVTVKFRLTSGQARAVRSALAARRKAVFSARAVLVDATGRSTAATKSDRRLRR